MSDSEQQLVVGAINGVYGIKGWVKVYSYTEPLDRILDYQPWILSKVPLSKGLVNKESQQLSVEIAQGKMHGKGVIALPKGFDTRDQAESLVGYEIRVSKDQLPSLPEGEFYWYELHGMQVINESSELLGEVEKMIETGANDVLVVRATSGSIDDEERLIPFVMDAIVKGVDEVNREIRVIWQSDY